MNLKIGEFNQRWMVHPRSEGDLILTSSMAIAIVNTTEKIAVVGPALKGLREFGQKLVTLRQDTVDRLLDAEEITKASQLPAHAIDFSELGVRVVSYDPSSSLASA